MKTGKFRTRQNFELSKLYHAPRCSILKPFGTAKLQHLNSHFTKKSEIVREIFLQLWKSDFDDFLTLYNVCAVPWGVLSTVGVFSTVGDIMSTVGDILSTVGGVHYRAGIS